MSESLPKFLDPRIQKKSFYRGGSIREGALTSVSAIGVSPDLSEPLPAGYVLKEYNFPTKSWKDSESLNIGFGINNIDSLENLQKMGSVLRRRQVEAERYFSDGLPDFVEPKQIIIGENRSGERRLFEVQKEIKGVSLGHYFEPLLEKLTLEQAHILQIEIKILIDKLMYIDKDEYYSENVLDLGSGNVFLTEDGHLRLIDTNIESSSRAPEQILFNKAIVQRRKSLIEILEKLSLKLKKMKIENAFLQSID